MKSEPDEASIDHLANAPHRTLPWTGVRNYQARNFMRDMMQVGDGVAGVAGSLTGCAADEWRARSIPSGRAFFKNLAGNLCGDSRRCAFGAKTE